MKKTEVTVGPCTAKFELVPVLTLIDQYFEGTDIFPPRENGKDVKLFEIDGYYLVLIENKPMCFLEKEKALEYIKMHGIEIKVEDDE